jgi:hypothetical protein
MIYSGLSGFYFDRFMCVLFTQVLVGFIYTGLLCGFYLHKCIWALFTQVLVGFIYAFYWVLFMHFNGFYLCISLGFIYAF